MSRGRAPPSTASRARGRLGIARSRRRRRQPRFAGLFNAPGRLELPRPIQATRPLPDDRLARPSGEGAADEPPEGLLDYTSPGALEATHPIFLFAVAFGLSTDYAVFLLARIKEARDSGIPNREAVAVGLERTGRIVTAAALLFCVAVAAFALSELIFLKELGVGTALGVLIDATVVRALLVPSLMHLLGEWNWWAPRPLRRLHGRIGLSEGAARA
jgi:hypothetical protein